MSNCSGCVCDPEICAGPSPAATLTRPRSWEEMVMILAAEENDLGRLRQLKYGPKNIPRLGEMGLLARVVDIVSRLEHCDYDPKTKDIVGGDFDDEKVEDCLIDIANFARYWRAYRRGWWTKDHCPPLLPPH